MSLHKALNDGSVRGEVISSIMGQDIELHLAYVGGGELGVGQSCDGI